jgi:adenylosuccinate synthase
VASSAWGVIGAGYGDEGKGLMTDALAAGHGAGAIVVRTNGGAQAGHTVQTPDGQAHVFHHVGSGALAGAATHLSRFFVHHPMLLGEEVRRLRTLGGNVRISADPRGYVTTPWDMMVNQAAEQARGAARHGSCGHGFGETVGRCEETPFGLTLGDLAAADQATRLRAIRDEWAPARLAALRADGDPALLASTAIFDRFMEDAAAFLELVDLRPDAALADAPAVIFEGAQGLLLDQHYGAFPYVTRSNTGVANMAAVAAEAGIARIDALYVTRCYRTRHGAGPLPGEADIAAHFAVEDPTNVPNAWQGSLRFAELDQDILREAIGHDLLLAGPVAVTPHLAVTCLDQALALIPFRTGGDRRVVPPEFFLASLADATGAASVMTASGPTRATVQWAAAQERAA